MLNAATSSDISWLRVGRGLSIISGDGNPNVEERKLKSIMHVEVEAFKQWFVFDFLKFRCLFFGFKLMRMNNNVGFKKWLYRTTP